MSDVADQGSCDDSDDKEVRDFNTFVAKIINSITKSFSDSKDKNVYSLNLKMEQAVPKPESITEFEKEPEPKAEPEPLMDVIDEGETVKVVLQLPSAKKEDIVIKAKPEEVTVSLANVEAQYSRAISMPCVIDPKKSAALYKNGILEITLNKAHSQNSEMINIQ